MWRTPNPEIVRSAGRILRPGPAVNGADLVLPDGIGVIKGAAMLGTPLKERTPGIEFAGRLMDRMAEEGRSLYLLGARPGVAETAARSWPRPIRACGSPAPTTAISRRTAR